MHIKVRVEANAKRETIEKLDEDTFKVCVREKAERNQANTRMLEIIARELSRSKEEIKIVAGHHYPNKILFIRNEK